MNSPAQIFITRGKQLETRSNQPFWLNDPESVWFIESGQVDVFSVPVTVGEHGGLRTHFFRADAGQVLFGLGAGSTDSGLGFLAVGGNEARVFKLSRTQLEDFSRQPDAAAEVVEWIDRWIQALYGGLSGGLFPKEFATLEPGKEIELTDSTAAQPEKGVVWARHLTGKSQLAGLSELMLTPDAGAIPIASSTWLHVSQPSIVVCADTASVLRQGLVWSGLQRFYEFVKIWAAANLQRVAIEEGVRLRAKKNSQQAAVEGAVSNLSSLLVAGKAGQPAHALAEDPLFNACLLIGQSLGVPIKPHPAVKKAQAQKDPLGKIAKASRIRLRRVILKSEWWTQDSGPILCYLQSTNQPVALLPTSASSYDMVDPVARTRQPVTPDIAQSLVPSAYIFYRPFPERALQVWEVFKFGLHNARADLVMVLLMGLGGGLLGTLMPIVTGVIFDAVIPSAARSQLLYLTLALFVAAFASVIFRVTRGIALLRVEAKSDASIEGAVWDRLLSLPLPFFRNYTSGDLATRANGINAIRQILSGAVLTSLLSGVFSVFNFVLLFYYSTNLALLASALVMMNVGVTVFVSYFSLRFQRPLFDLQGKISGQVLQFITGISKLRVAGAEPLAYSVWAKAFSNQKKLDMKAAAIFNALGVFNEIYPIITSMFLFSALAFWVEQGISTGKFLAFNAAFSTFLYAMLDISSAWLSILHAVPLYERAKPILQTLPEVSEAKSDPGDLTGRIELSHVSFRYKADGPLVLNDVSFQIKPGEFVAIVGASGSGKSTLMRLLLGFEAPESGTIYHDGLDLAGLDVQAVRRQCGVVLQNGKLMPGDIYQNIIGSSLLTVDDAWEAAQQAGFDEEIQQMPMGMHTVLSEGAGTLSGGQRQRLMIARAIVARPRILLFDEATSALDNRTQSIVSRSLEQLRATRIVIAHRLSTIINADHIFVMQDGRLVQTGNYEQLIHQTGPFAELAKRQIA